MNFLGVGPAELVVILVVALIFVGPERLPKLAADIARTIREIRKYTGSLAAEFNEVIQDFEKDTEGERSAWKEIGEGLTGATKSVTEAVREARADAQGAGASTDTSAAAASANVASTRDVADPEPARWTDIPSTLPDATAPASPPANGSGSLTPPAARPAEEVR